MLEEAAEIDAKLAAERQQGKMAQARPAQAVRAQARVLNDGLVPLLRVALSPLHTSTPGDFKEF
jgi:hypothetical protein